MMMRTPLLSQLLSNLLSRSVKTLSLTLALALMTGPLGLSAYAAAGSESNPMFTRVQVPNGSKRISLEASDEDLRGLLRNLAQQSGINLVLDESVTGTVSLQLDNVTINEALESVATLASLEILPQNGNIYLALGKEAAKTKGLARHMSKVIKINYGNATRVASVLNQSLFAQATTGGILPNKVQPDSRTNSIVVVGTTHEIELAEKAVRQLDVPRQSRTFYLSHANALNVAAQLASSIFNDGTGSLMLQGGNTAAAATTTGPGGAMGPQPATVRVDKEDIAEGQGINDFGGGSDTEAAISQNVKLRGYVKSTETAQVSPLGPLVVPDTRLNAVTVMGTAEQIAMAESLIPVLDAKAPQVAIEVSLVEITAEGTKQLENSIGLAGGRIQSGFNNINGLGPNTAGGLSGLNFSTAPNANSPDYSTQLRSLIEDRKARVLANPTVVATHDTESIISIVDEIVRGVEVQLDDTTGFITQTLNIGEAGIVMDILPKVGEDGTVSMRLRPSVTTILSDDAVDALGNAVTLLSKRDLLTQNVRVRDGETLVLGGLIKEQSNHTRRKLPGLGQMPIVGAMFRASDVGNLRSELVIMITPHIMNQTELTPVSYTEADMPKGNASW